MHATDKSPEAGPLVDVACMEPIIGANLFMNAGCPPGNIFWQRQPQVFD
jgi:hypothetical protein